MDSVESICKTDPFGNKRWFLKGKFHRIDGPALEYVDGEKHWYINGKLHRADGPAVDFPDGVKYWCLDYKQYSFEEWDRLRKMLWIL